MEPVPDAYDWNNRGIKVLWLLVYMMIGMVYVSIQMRPILQKVLKEQEDDEKGEANTIAVALILICLFTPLWPAF